MSENSGMIPEQQKQSNEIAQTSQIYELNCESSESSDNQYRANYISASISKDNIEGISINSDEAEDKNIFSYYENLKYRAKQSSDESENCSDLDEDFNKNEELRLQNQKSQLTENKNKQIKKPDQNEKNNASSINNQKLICQPERNFAFEKGNRFEGEQCQSKEVEKSQKLINQCNAMIQQTFFQNQDRILPHKKKTKRKNKYKIFPQRIHIRKKTTIKEIPGSNKSSSQISSEQRNTLKMVFFQRKKQNHTLLKKWNYQRIKALDTHRKVVDQINKSIDQKTVNSLKNFETYQQFYIERADQEEKYLKNMPNNVENSFSKNQISHKVYICSGSFMANFNNNFIEQKEEKTKNFLKIIRQDILFQLFESYYLDNGKKKLTAIRQQISTLKMTLEKINNAVTKKLIILEDKFLEASNNVTQSNTQIDRDFYLIQQSFLRKCCQQIQYQLILAKKTVQYCEAVKEQQKRRAVIIRNSLLLFGKEANINSSNSIDLNSSLEQLSKSQQEKLIEEFYSFEELLCEKIIVEIKHSLNQCRSPTKTKGSQSDSQNLELSVSDFFYFFNKYPLQFSEFDCCHLIVKQFKIDALLQWDQDYSKKQRWVGANLIVTIDKFVHIFPEIKKDESVSEYHKPYFSMKLNYIQLQQFQQIISQKNIKKIDNESKQYEKKVEIPVKWNSKKELSESSQNQSQSVGTTILVKIMAKKSWKDYFVRTQLKANNECLIRFYCQQQFMEFQDYLSQFIQ